MNNDLKNFQGSIVATVTPFKDDGSVDYEAFGRLIEFHLASGTGGIAVCATTGENPTLTEAECSELIKFTVEKVAGRMAVIAGTGTNSTVKTIHNCQTAENLGVDGLLIVGPYYNKPTAQGFYLHYSEIAKSTKLPIIVYNVPGRTGKNIPTNILLKLANEFSNIYAVKEASGDISQIMDILNKRPAGFKVYSGDDALTFPLICMGADGCVSVVANEIPAEFSNMIKLTLAGKYDEARELHFKYLDLMQINFIESNPMPVKTAVSLMGYLKENFRSPMCRMEKQNRDKLQDQLLKLGLIKN